MAASAGPLVVFSFAQEGVCCEMTSGGQNPIGGTAGGCQANLDRAQGGEAHIRLPERSSLAMPSSGNQGRRRGDSVQIKP